MARVTILNSEVWLAELGCAVAVLWQVTLIVTRPTLSSSRKELKREFGEEKLSENINLTAVNDAPNPQCAPRRKGIDLQPSEGAVNVQGNSQHSVCCSSHRCPG